MELKWLKSHGSFFLFILSLDWWSLQVLSNLLVGSIPLCPFSASHKAKRRYASEMKSFHPHNMLTLLQEMTLDPRIQVTLLVSVLCMHVCVLSLFRSVHLLVTPWTVARPAPLYMGFSRQEHWSGLPCPPPGDLPDSGITPASLRSPVLAGRLCVLLPTYLGSRVTI